MISAPLWTLWGAGAGLVLAAGAMKGAENAGTETGLHDTYAVVAHSHLALPIAAVFAVFALFYFIVPRVTGRRANPLLSGIHLWTTSAGAVLIYLPHLWLSFVGMPERAVDFPGQMAWWNIVSVAGYCLTTLGLIAFIGVLGALIFRPSVSP